MNEVGKKELDMLLHNTWIVKEQNSEVYYGVKNKLDTIKKFINEQLGSRLIVHPKFIKLEKVPVIPKDYMGLDTFNDPLEYVLLMLVLLYLEDKQSGEQFVLSWLAEFIKTTALSLELSCLPNWDLLQHRKCLVKVLDYLKSIYVIKVCEEEKVSFVENAKSEGLYETTGISNYLVRVFKNDIFNYEKLDDFSNDEWLDQSFDKGDVRRYRVYRSLVYTPAVYHEEILESDLDYIKKQRFKIQKDLDTYTDGELEVTKSMSVVFYPVLNQKQYFPNNKMISDIVLMVNDLLLNKIENDEIILNDKEIVQVSEPMMARIIKEIKDERSHYLSKQHQNLTFDKFYQEIISYMESYGFISKVENGYKIYPMVGRLVGKTKLKQENKSVEQMDIFGG